MSIRSLVTIVFSMFVFSFVGLAHSNNSNNAKSESSSVPSELRNKLYRIHGTVTDEDGRPAIGATVRIKNTTLGCKVGTKGEFYLKKVPYGTHVLQITSVGKEPIEQEVIVNDVLADEVHVSFSMKDKATRTGSVVVTATRTDKIYQDVPVKVSVLDAQVFENTQSPNVFEGVKFQPGLRVENMCQNCGFAEIKLNGLEGRYSQILIDSRPVFSALNGVYGLEQIPANMIERVEVVRGGGSALYGGSAVGGVVNIITKDPVDNTMNATITQSFTEAKVPDFVAQMNASVINDQQDLGLFVFGLYRDRKHWDANGDGFSEICDLTMNTFGSRLFYKPDHLSKLSLEFHAIKDDRRGGDQFDLPPHRANITESARHNTISGGITYDKFFEGTSNKISIYTSFQQTTRNTFYGAKSEMYSDEFVDAYGTTDNETYVGGVQYTHTLQWAGSHVWTMGYELTYDDILDQAPAYDRTIDQFARDHGIYIQDDWAINEDFSFLFGSRFDKHNFIDGVVVSPRANIMYKAVKDLNIRATFSTGFRSPQAFDEDLHITQVSGEALVHLNSPDLKPEYSMSFGASVDYTFEFSSIPTSISLEYFNTHLDDVFVNVTISDEDDAMIIEEKRNGGGATVHGGTVELQMLFDDEMNLKTGFTVQSSQYDESEQWNENNVLPGQSNFTKDMLRSPDWYGYFSYNYAPIHELELNLSGILTGPMLIPHYAGGIGTNGLENEYDQLEKSGSFFELNAQVTVEINHENNVKAFVGVQNILNSFQDDFDRGLGRDAAYIYGPTRPFTVFCGIKTSI